MRSPLTISLAAVALIAGSAGPAAARPATPGPVVTANRVDAQAHAATIRELGRRRLAAARH
jgi:hypothetical protein